MVSDAIWLALINAATPTLTAVSAIIIALRAIHKIKVKDAHKEGADQARARRQRKTDPPADKLADKLAEQLAGAQRVPSAADLAQPGYPLTVRGLGRRAGDKAGRAL